MAKPLTARREPTSDPVADRIAAQIAAIDWPAIEAVLDAHGCATTGALLPADDCAALAGLYASDAPFRSRVIMARHGFGRGEYKYLAYPLPAAVAAMRAALYPPLAAIANRWNDALGIAIALSGRSRRISRAVPCGRADAADATAAAIRRRRLQLPAPGPVRRARIPVAGDRAAVAARAVDFTGGEFVLTEQRPRMQSRAEVVPLAQGEAVIFPVHHRPVRGTRGVYRVNMRHGVSRLREGRRHTLGIIFHDAK